MGKTTAEGQNRARLRAIKPRKVGKLRAKRECQKIASDDSPGRGKSPSSIEANRHVRLEDEEENFGLILAGQIKEDPAEDSSRFEFVEHTIKQEVKQEEEENMCWDDIFQRESNQDYNITTEDIDTFVGESADSLNAESCSPLCTLVTVEENSDENLVNAQSHLKNSDATEHNFEKEITPKLLMQYTGLRDLHCFYDILYYIEDHLVDLEGISKFQQLFTVLTKLHLDKDAYNFDKFKFPAVYVTIIEILYERYVGQFESFPKASVSVPDVMKKIVDKKAPRIAILDVLKFYARSNAKTSTQIKYLVGYTVTGNVFFLSRSFPGSCAFWYLVQKSGILEAIGKDGYFFYKFGRHYYGTTANEFEKLLNEECHCGRKVTYGRAQEYLTSVVSNIKVKFKVLTEEFPMYMLRYETDGECFIHKLVYVCAYLLKV